MKQEEFENQQDKYLTKIPEELHEAIKWIAWENGHPYGLHEVIINVQDIADTLEEPVQKLINRIKLETMCRVEGHANERKPELRIKGS